MKRKFFLGMLAAIAAGGAHAQLGGLGGLMGGSKGGGGNIDIDKAVAGFNGDAALLREAIFYSMVQINAALRNKEDRATTKAALEAREGKTDPKEQGAIEGNYIKSNLAATNTLLASEDAKQRMAKLEPQMQQRVAKSMFAVGVAALRLPKTVDTGKKIMESVGSNPMNISKVVPVKDGLALFADVLPKLPELVSVGMKMMRDVKVDPGNPTAEATITPVKDKVDFDA